MQCGMHVGRMNLHLFTLKIFALAMRHCGSGDGGDRVLVSDEERCERERKWFVPFGLMSATCHSDAVFYFFLWCEIAKIAFIMRAIAHIVR